MSIWRCATRPTRFSGKLFPRDQLLISPNVVGERHVLSGLRFPFSTCFYESEGHLHSQKLWFMKHQRMQYSKAAIYQIPQTSTDSKEKKASPVIYRGPLSDTLRKVKMLSITSCCLSVITGPAITFLTSPNLSVILKGGIATTIILLSASTTAALHWFVGPYVHKLTWIPGAKEFELEMITWLATFDRKVISIEDIRPPKTNRPFVSFAVKDNFYFVDTEKIPNKDLLRIVTFYQSNK